jgi:hypothetical protein
VKIGGLSFILAFLTCPILDSNDGGDGLIIVAVAFIAGCVAGFSR